MSKLYLEGTKNLKLENENEIELSYYLMECRKKDNQETLYGIQIQKKDGEKVEIENSGCISYSKEFVLQMIHKMMEGTVTPITMLYIIDDIMTEKLCS
ncbi:hypothetical protein EDD66_1025 [Mobilisporobacter senegalensis]|uniref:Uncharacterized protein n=1 Tax=Mobilisporobacter senegalensis TaxID=1329262 RepID=A0A3N1XUQ2_9FIRM|nr:DUF6514 family protein [Mobilisporobacter senegalensis]ROR30354.1 hypothetical protein EDD66_1025 [Mobilisporobacter senegalensis]